MRHLYIRPTGRTPKHERATQLYDAIRARLPQQCQQCERPTDRVHAGARFENRVADRLPRRPRSCRTGGSGFCQQREGRRPAEPSRTHRSDAGHECAIPTLRKPDQAGAFLWQTAGKAWFRAARTPTALAEPRFPISLRTDWKGEPYALWHSLTVIWESSKCAGRDPTPPSTIGQPPRGAVR